MKTHKEHIHEAILKDKNLAVFLGRIKALLKVSPEQNVKVLNQFEVLLLFLLPWRCQFYLRQFNHSLHILLNLFLIYLIPFKVFPLKVFIKMTI